MIAPKASLISTPQATFSQPSKLSTTTSLYVHQLSQKQFTWPQPFHNQANPRLLARYIPESNPREQRGQRWKMEGGRGEKGSSPREIQDYRTTRLQDYKTTGLKDHKTTRPLDYRPPTSDLRPPEHPLPSPAPSPPIREIHAIRGQFSVRNPCLRKRFKPRNTLNTRKCSIFPRISRIPRFSPVPSVKSVVNS